MRAVVFAEPGDESVLAIGEVASPECGEGQLKLRVRATAVNRADLLQRRGMYPAPKGASPLLGLEAAGEVMEVGQGVQGWRVGARAMALLAGGGYAEEVVVDAGSAMPIPSGLTFIEGAAIPEVFLTAFSNLFEYGALTKGEIALVHGGSSGVGTAAIQLITQSAARAIVTVRNEQKAAACRALGAETILYSTEDFVARIKELTDGRGADLILDCLGASYFERNLLALATGGRLVIIGLQGGLEAKLNLGLLLQKRARVIGSTLRARHVDDKARLVRAFSERFYDGLARGTLRPVIDRVFSLDDVQAAHRLMATSDHIGKIVLSL